MWQHRPSTSIHCQKMHLLNKDSQPIWLSSLSLLWFTLLWHYLLPFSHTFKSRWTLLSFLPPFSCIHHPLILYCIHSASLSSILPSFFLSPPRPCLILLNLLHSITSDLGLKASCLHTVSRYWSSHKCALAFKLLHVCTYETEVTQTHTPYPF